jgi:para-nitrobenzyl esterase
MNKPPSGQRPQVALAQGLCAGVYEGDLSVYRGIPYAEPPFGARRFMPPEAAKPWQGVLDASSFGPVAPQASSTLTDPPTWVGGENCLTVNIWHPSATAEKRPVMVWFPGGGFMRGGSSDSLYDGASFARQGVVFVSFNYRLGIDGFAQLPGLVANRGLLDQLAALRWVQDNIHHFGGDAASVTAFGVSAGAGALACLMAMPQSRGLMQRAILQSPSVSVQTPAENEVAVRAIASCLGVDPTAKALASAPLAQLVTEVARLASSYPLRQQHGLNPRNFFPLRPVVDGQVLPLPPLEGIAREWANGQGTPQEVLVGANADEMNFYLVPNQEIDTVDMARVEVFAQACGLGADEFTAYRQLHANATPGELLSRMQSDFYYRVPATLLAELAQAKGKSVRLYDFQWRSPQCDGCMGAAHAMELPFVFNTLASPNGLAFAGPGAPQALADQLHPWWAEFARTGQCSAWPAWSAHQQGRMCLAMPTDWQAEHADPALAIWRKVFGRPLPS